MKEFLTFGPSRRIETLIVDNRDETVPCVYSEKNQQVICSLEEWV